MNLNRRVVFAFLISTCTASNSFATTITPTVTIPGVQYSGNYSTSFWNGGSFTSDAASISTFSGSSGGSAGGNSATLSFGSSLGAPMITGTASAAAPDLSHINSSSLTFILNYYFVATGPAATANVDISASGIKSGVVGGASFQGAVTVFNPILFGGTALYKTPNVTAATSNWSVNDSFTVTTDQVYNVQLFLQIGAAAGLADTAEGATVTIDPQFFIDLNQGGLDPSNFALFFSDSVVNLPGTSETPLPAALPLFATGVGALGLLGCRRKRKAAALAA